MKTLVFNNGVEKTELEFKTRNGHFSFTSNTTEYTEMTWEEMKDLCSSYVEDLYSVKNFMDNPDNSFNDFVEDELHNIDTILDCEDFEYTDNGCHYWEYTCGGQSQHNVPTELVELWEKYHLVDITDENKHVVEEIENVIAKYEIQD